MVKKLFKHEFIAYMRTLIPMYIILVGIAALTRFVYIFENDSTIFSIVGTSSIVAFVVACIVSIILTYVRVITRFYKNLFTNEGYLSFTLPVTTRQHITVKLVVGGLSIIATVLLILISICIATAGEMATELFKALAYTINEIQIELEYNIWPYIAEVILWLIVGIFSSVLLFYFCVAIGQLAKKNRVIAAIGVYFAYYFLTQIIGTVLIAVFSVINDTAWFNDLMIFIEKHIYASVHVFLAIGIVFTALMGLIYFAVTHLIIKKKLNLE